MLIRHIIGYVPSTVIPALAAFASIFCYTRLLSPQEYGRYVLALNLMTVLVAVFFYWLHTALPRLMSAAIRAGGARDMQATAYVAYLIVAICVLLIAAIAWGFIPPGDWKKVAVFALPLALLRALIGMNQTFHRSALDFRRYNLVECGQALIGLVAGIALVWLGFGSAGAVFGLMAGMVVMLGADARFMRASLRAKFSKAMLMEIARFGLPLVFSYGFALTTSLSDRFIIEHYYGAAQVGIYAAGYTLMDRISTILFMLVALPSLPLTLHKLEHEGIQSAQRQTYQTGTVILAIALPACAGLLMSRHALVNSMIGEEFRAGALQVIPWIAVSALMNGVVTHYFDHAFHFARKLYLLLLTQGPAACLNLALNFILIPRYGIMGAAYATVISYGVLLALSAGVGRRFAFPIRFPFVSALQILIATLLMVLLLSVISFPPNLVGLLAMIAAGGTVYGAALVAFNVLELRTYLLRLVR